MLKAALRSRHTERQALPLSLDEKLLSSVEVRNVASNDATCAYIRFIRKKHRQTNRYLNT